MEIKIRRISIKQRVISFGERAHQARLQAAQSIKDGNAARLAKRRAKMAAKADTKVEDNL